MLIHPQFDPIAFEIGPLAVRWYGLMYLVGFLGGGLFGVWRARLPNSQWRVEEVWDLLFYVAVGVVVGGRLGYALFYNLPYYAVHPHEILYIWTGGMSFHGGLIGVVVAIWMFARRSGRMFLEVGDFLAPLCPIGLGAGRIGNFINQELWGRPSDLPWAMVFPAADSVPRHPSQLYEFLLEGVLLFVVLWLYSRRKRTPGAVSGLFLCGYGMARFAVEFFRQPDAHIGTIAFGWVTMGQLLSVPLVVIGFWLYAGALRRGGESVRADAGPGNG